MKFRKLILFIIILLYVFINASLCSEEIENKKGFCFRGRPINECNSFMITEVAYLKRISRNEKYEPWPGFLFNNDLDFYFSADIGYMKNIGQKNAIGGTLYFGFDDNNSRLAIKPRYRRWLSHKTHLDISAGVIFFNINGYIYKSPGFTGNVGLGISNIGTLLIQLEITPYSGLNWDNNEPFDGHETVLYGGIKLGSYPGVTTLVIAPITFFVIYIIGMAGSN